MSRSFVLLLPPSQGKTPGGRGAPWHAGGGTLPALDEPRRQVLDALAAAGTDLRGAPTRRALDRYDGVLYRELDAASLSVGARRRLGRTVLIADGLLGLVAPADPLPDHRIKTADRVEGLGRLATFWRPHLTAALVDRLSRRVVWDLWPQEHSAAWDPTAVPTAARIRVRFVDGSGRTVSHWNKLLKGALVRHLVETGLDDPDGLRTFTHPAGYRYDPDATTTDGVTDVTFRA